MFDDSYSNMWSEIRKLGFNEEDYPIKECTGGGRIFEKDFIGNINTELSYLIQKYEDS